MACWNLTDGGKPGPTSLAELYRGCALALFMARGTPQWMLFLQASFYQGKKGKSPPQVAESIEKFFLIFCLLKEASRKLL